MVIVAREDRFGARRRWYKYVCFWINYLNFFLYHWETSNPSGDTNNVSLSHTHSRSSEVKSVDYDLPFTVIYPILTVLQCM